MADRLRKVKPGDPLVIPAETFNAFIDAARFCQDHRLNQARAGLAGSQDSNLVIVKNASGQDRARFEILGIDSPVISPTDNLDQFLDQPALIGVSPTVADHSGKFVILAEPIHSGSLGWAWLSGVCPVRIQVTNQYHSHADIASGTPTAYLASRAHGAAQILWKEPGTGVKWAIVRLGRWTPTVFPVRLEMAGGSQGNESDPATWIYDVQDMMTGQDIEQNVNPVVPPHHWRRPSVGYVEQATFGFAYYNNQGQLSLGWINEVAEQEGCEESV